MTRELFLRRFVEAWLVHQREAYEAEHHGGDDGQGPGGRQAVPLEEVVLVASVPSGSPAERAGSEGRITKAEVLEEISGSERSGESPLETPPGAWCYRTWCLGVQSWGTQHVTVRAFETRDASPQLS